MYKSTTSYRKPQQQSEQVPEKYRAHIQHLQELFPAWSNEDLLSVLAETGGDLSVAATRITEGHVEQWGSVHRKKDKKPPANSQSHSKDFPGSRERGDFRGARGARGGRGGPGRGGAARGAFARAAHQDSNGRPSKLPSSQSTDSLPTKRTEDAPPADSVPHSDSLSKPADDSPIDPVALSDPPSTDNVAWSTPTPPTWGPDHAPNGSSTLPHPAQPPPPVKHLSKTPATSKLSFAQVARRREELPLPAPTPASIAAPPAPTPAPPPPPIPVQLPPSLPEPIPAREPSPSPQEPTPEPATQGWEDPTTVEVPTWDDEPVAAPQDAWNSLPQDSPAPTEPEPQPVEEPVAAPPPPMPVPVPEPAPERVLSALPVQLQTPQPKAEPVQIPSIIQVVKPTSRPSSAAHRHSARFKQDQAVVMPSGNFGVGVEKIGMQFGSLSLGGDDLDAPPASSKEEPAPEPALIQAPEPAAAPEPIPAPPPPQTPPALQAQAQVPEFAPPAISSPVAQSTLSVTSALFQQAIPQQIQQAPQQPSQPAPVLVPAPPAPVAQPQTLPTSISQPILPIQIHQPPPSTTSLSTYAHQAQASSQQSLASHLSQQQVPTQPTIHSQQGSLHQFSQHSLPSHIEQNQVPQTSQQSQVPPVSQQPNVNVSSHASYFRQQEAPYFHTPTPPVSGQNQESPYGTFGQLGNQLGHQVQASHIGGFGGGDYGYGEGQRTFYDSYTGAPSGFGNRNALGHEDIKGLPGAPQQSHSAPGLPPATSQASQQLPQSSQSGNQAQPGGQGPQGGYPPPLPYYYPYPQNQFYGTPYNSGFTAVPQPYVKYPTVFPGPPGPQSAPSPAGKQAPTGVQPQSPYGQGLYGQQHPANAYEDIGYHGQHGQGVGGLQQANEYSKQLYGSAGQGIQGFMGLGQTTGPSGGAPLGQRGAGGSPEAAYKPYAGNVGVKDGGSGGIGQGQGGPQGRGGVQQPQQGGFYGGQRFGSGAGVVPPGAQSQQGHQPQGQGPQGHLQYPQGGSESTTFYSYRGQQQGYWQ